jgi:hypothetical protein
MSTMTLKHRTGRRTSPVGWPTLADQVIGAVCEEYTLSRGEFLGGGRVPVVVDARRTCAVVLFDMGVQVSHIARAMGQDHSTTIHHIAVWQHKPSYEVRETVASVRRVLRQRGIAA